MFIGWLLGNCDRGWFPGTGDVDHPGWLTLLIGLFGYCNNIGTQGFPGNQVVNHHLSGFLVTNAAKGFVVHIDLVSLQL